MDDYISREEAKRFFNLNFGGVSHAIIASRLIDEIPAADVAPVVRCGDCIWWNKSENSIQGECALNGSLYPTSYWFCANGARKKERR